MQKSKIKMGADGKRPSNAARAGGAQIQITNNGPYLVSGGLPLMKAVIVVDARGTPVEYAWGDRYRKQERYSLCRCGKSRNPPFCDGTHTAVHFSGEETANREPYIEQAGQITGPALVLTDAEPLCALARFCHRGGDVWTLTEESDDPESRDMAIRDAWDCPAGRLVVWDPETEKPMEPGLKPGIALIEDPDKGVSGPIWVMGGVPVVSSDGTVYEVRNRVTLCRCGKSRNKPFCDGKHIPARFDDGDESLHD
jgi:CDGSH-type Zn-finger protein